MRKIISFLFISTLVNASYASYLDDWSNDDHCGWMESTSIPKYIQEEVDKREILCSRGIEVSVINPDNSNVSEHGTIFASPDPSLIIKVETEVQIGYSY